jgi:DNA polymerase-3 subunit delta
MQEKGWSEGQMTSFLKIHPYRVILATQAVRFLSVKQLKEALKRLIATDFEIKTGRADKDYLFDLALIRLSSRG